jgi:uncharacterized protein
MTNFLPIFPLGIVAYPTEVVSLHIFEPRYKQLIHECYTQSKLFVIPIVIAGMMQEKATVMQVISIENEYANGEMDIKCLGLHTCILLEIMKEIPDKLYGGAIVIHEQSPIFGNHHHQKIIIAQLHSLHQLLKVEKKYKKHDADLTSFDIAHHIGLSIVNEYEVLCLAEEAQRLIMIGKHLQEGILQLNKQQSTIERIQLNGDFRNLSLDDFDFKKI